MYHQYMRRTLNSMRFLLALCLNLLISVLVAYGIGDACMHGYRFCYEIFGPVVAESSPGTERSFEVTTADTMWQVADRLEQDGLIVNRYSFYLRTEWMDEESVRLRPGEYELNTSMTYEEIINQLTASG